MTGIELSVYSILNLIAPFLISLFKSVSWPRWEKLLLAFGVAVLIGAGVPFIQGAPTVNEIAMSVLAAIGIQQTLYAFFEKSNLEDRLRKSGVK